LTALTTYKGALPQGWKTSAYLANLAFWESEPKLVEKLNRQGLSYSRFMDDVTVSSRRPLNSSQKSNIISAIYGMLAAQGFRPKRSKHEISTPEMPMRVTGLSVNSRKPLIPKAERRNIKAKVYQLEQVNKERRDSFKYLKDWRSANGHVNRVKSFHPREGEQLQQRMNEIKPPKHMLSKRSGSKKS